MYNQNQKLLFQFQRGEGWNPLPQCCVLVLIEQCEEVRKGTTWNDVFLNWLRPEFRRRRDPSSSWNGGKEGEDGDKE